MASHDTRTAYNVNIIHNLLKIPFKYVHTVYNQDDAAVDLTGKAVVFTLRKYENGPALATISVGDGVTIATNVVTYEKDISSYIKEGVYYYDIVNTTDNEPIQDGKLICTYTARNV